MNIDEDFALKQAWEGLKSKYDRNMIVNSLKKMNPEAAKSLDMEVISGIQDHANSLFDSGHILESFKYIQKYLELAVQLNNLGKEESNEL